MPQLPLQYLCGNRVSNFFEVYMKELLYNVWLSLACTPGLATFSKLLARFKTAEEIYFADDEAIAASVSSKFKD